MTLEIRHGDSTWILGVQMWFLIAFHFEIGISTWIQDVILEFQVGFGLGFQKNIIVNWGGINNKSPTQFFQVGSFFNYSNLRKCT